MKHLISLLLVGILHLTVIGQTPTETSGSETNQVDAENKKQGYWIIKDASGKVIEEGEYKDNRKNGLWKAYFPSGKVKSEITFIGSRPKGAYKLYYESGIIQEEGVWSSTKNTGNFKRYHTNGKIAQNFQFSSNGKREGEQKYYYENGELRLTGVWAQGQESGELKEFYENGDLKSVRNFSSGVMDKDTYAEYAPKKPMINNLKKELNAAPSINVKASNEELPNQGGFNGNGYYKLYSQDMQITKDGIFKDYRFMDGKMYDYDDNGLVIQIKIFKDGRYIGDGVIADN
tara:strand:- start:352 stop:1215 length:864 start_codon:yes stop_codon:yes gene_type:complete